MDKFVNITSNNQEKAIKIGTNVPDGAVGLSWFSTKEISPKNNIVTLDLSETIPENNTSVLGSDNEAIFVISDELGVLKTLDGKYGFSGDDLTISNLFLHKPTATEYQNLDEINPNDFVHWYYTSRFFISAPSNFFYTGITQFLDQDRFKNLKIKVVDQNGLDYVDPNTGRKKYRILLEPFATEINKSRFEIPHRIVVLLDSSDPINLRLNYDKVESNDTGDMFHYELNYFETINAVSVYENVPEEAFVIDDNYQDKRQFSTKKINQKYSNIIENINLESGFQVIAPSKPIEDNRIFEAFNWRLVARTRTNVNFSSINEDLASQIINKTIKVAVLYSSNSNQSNSTIYPYIFHRLESSPFNLSSFNFINPAQETIYQDTVNGYTKNDADYWKLDIDSVNSLDDYDVLAWSPDSTITSSQALKLQAFIRNNGTLLLDLSYIPVNTTALSPQLNISSTRITSEIEEFPTLATHLFNSSLNGGWNIESGIFENSQYGIYGSRLSSTSLSYKQYLYFDNAAEANSAFKLGPNEEALESVCVQLSSTPETDALVRGNIIGVTFRLMSYCNSIYSIANTEQIIDSNSGSSYVGGTDSNVFSSIVEGPFKFLYNIVSYAAYCRLEATREVRTNSSLYNFVTNWYSDWVMDGSALWQDEIDQSFVSLTISGGISVYAKKLTSGTIADFYRSQFSTFLQSHNQDIVFGNLANTEFFIEVTNPDVELYNAFKVGFDESNINSSYNVFKVQSNSEAIYGYATLNKTSPKLTIPEGIGPYVIKNKEYSSSDLPILREGLNIIRNSKSYPFSLQSKYSYLSATDKPSLIDIDFTTSAKLLFKGTFTEQRSVVIDGTPTTSLVSTTLNCTDFKSAVDDIGNLRETSSSKPGNIFLYTGDIDIHKDPRQWKIGSTTTRTTTTTTPTTVTRTIPGVNQTINTTYNISLLSEGSAKWMNNTNEPSVVTKIRQFFGESYSTWMKTWTGKTVRVFSGPTYYGNIYTVNKIIGTNYILYKVSVSGPDDSRLNPVGIFANPEPKLVEIPKTFQTTIPGQSQQVTETVNVTTTTGGTSAANNYVKYIQYTVSAVGNQTCIVDGIYGNQTTNAVKGFQIANNQRYLDGSVDSETKSYMAFAWKELKATNLTRFNTLRQATLSQENLKAITAYIDAAVAAGTTADINTKTYKKLTFSGFAGPGEGMDIIYFKIPNQVHQVEKIVIEADSNPVWRNYSIVNYGYASSYSSDIFKYTVKSANKTAATGTIEIPFNNISGSDARYMWIQVVGKSLNGYGKAEGFSIKSIKVNGKVYVTTTPNPETELQTFTSDIYMLAGVNLVDSIAGVSPSQTKTKQYSTSSFPRLYGTMTSLVIDVLNDGTIPTNNILENGPVSIDSSFLEDISLTENIDSLFLTDKVKINFSTAPSLIWIENTVIDSFSSYGLEINDGSPVGLSYVNNGSNTSSTLTAQTSAAYYSDAVFHQVGPFALSSYRLRRPNSTPLVGTRNSVSVEDGVMLLCNDDGAPFGIFDRIAINPGVLGVSAADQEETNLTLGVLSVESLIGDQDGFAYGFYDKNKLEFIGRTIPYTELLTRGISNIYIAVYAYDADGNTMNQQEYVGPSIDTTFIAPRIPLKVIHPIYSLKLKRSSAIRVNQIDQNLSKFDLWNLPVSLGSFWKNINIDQRVWPDWKSKYVGQTTKAFYSSFDELVEEGSSGFEVTNSKWSQIYGYGFYDVKDEHPVLLDDRTIQLRRAPLMNIMFPTSDLNSLSGIIKHGLEVYTREDVNSEWQQISWNLVRDVDSYNGIIKFRNRIIPSDAKLIKVNYVTANKSRLIHQVNGELMPLNPLFSSLIDFENGSKFIFDAPLYIYLLPKVIYKQNTILTDQNTVDTNLVKVQEYSCNGTIKFTYDNSIFNKDLSAYNPYALPIAMIYVTNSPYKLIPDLYDIRVRGGGVDPDVSTSELIDSIPEVLSNWDVYPPSGMAYARGGYVIIRIPSSVKDHFIDEKEIYQIISNNLTAGIAYELQDMDGNSWN